MLETAVHIIDHILYFVTSAAVMYLFVFALASRLKGRPAYPETGKLHRFAVIFPAYREDRVIVPSASSFLNQDYPAGLFDVVVVSDRMKDETDGALRQLGITVIKACYEDSSKAKALQLAMETLDGGSYDAVVVMDADNLADPGFLREVNKALPANTAIQTHRTAKNRDTATAMLDAVNEEINNSIFRKGHVNMGMPSALIGSGMVFDYKWFRDNISDVSTAGEDKELEALLLRRRIFTEYLPYVNVYDEKTPKDAAFYNQRRRWIAAQYGALRASLPDVFKAIRTKNLAYCDKIFQWMLPPRIIMMGAIGLTATVFTLYDPALSAKWWGLLLLLILTLLIAIPGYLLNRGLLRSIRKIPGLGLLMFLNLFRLKGANKKFIHTEHE